MVSPPMVRKASGAAEVFKEQEACALQGGEVRQEVIGGDEERDLQNQCDRAPEGVDRLVVVLAVEGLGHHVALVALEGLLDVLEERGHLFLPVLLFALDLVGAVIERQQQEVDGKAQGDDGRTAVAQIEEGERIDRLQYQRDR